MKKAKRKSDDNRRICKDCDVEIFANVNMVIVKDDIWKSICDEDEDNICDKCMEKRLGRTITEKDFEAPYDKSMIIIPCNYAWLQYRKDTLMNKTK